MITIIYSTNKNDDYNDKFEAHLKNSAGLSDIQILKFTNFNQFSLAEVYNKGINEAKYDIIICCHNDIKLESGWGNKLLRDFENNPNYGIIGKAGSCFFPESGIYWEKMNQTMVGQVYHHPKDSKKWLNTYSPKLPFLVEVVTLDGLFLAFNKTKIIHKFDENMGKFHFYDHGFCVPNYLDGVKMGVTSSFEIIHESVGQPNEEFFITKDKFIEKYKNNLPLDLKPNVLYVPDVIEKPIKNIGKVAVIIPTKSNIDNLLLCIDSFFDYCNPDKFDIFIGYAGSSSEEKEKIETHLIKYNNVTLIEYDYYNFSNISNDIVNNHTANEHEYLLFCNDDIIILNNVLYGMLKTFKEVPKTGTIGARLHLKDNRVNSCGIGLFVQKKLPLIGNLSFNNYYNYSKSQINTISNSSQLVMIKKVLFHKIGNLNINYNSEMSLIELNFKLVAGGYENITDCSLVAYSSDNILLDKATSEDFKNCLYPFISDNFTKLKHKAIIID